LTNALLLVRLLREPLRRLRVHDPKLADQGETAGDSVALNTAEGRGRDGRDRRHFFTIAYSSACEVETVLQVEIAKGYLVVEELDEVLQALDRQKGLLYGCKRSAARVTRRR